MSVLVLWVCLQGGYCQNMVGQVMPAMSCKGLGGQAAAADFINKNPEYEVKKYHCVKPEELYVVLGRNQA